MTKKMLIDASHPEETRVVIVEGNRVEELDFESRHKRQIRGNVYLARVTRVEPSLQAAFIEYGGNRHGFLAFSEIHPDYYQIPHEDKLALLEAEEAENKAAEEEEDASDQDDDEVDENLDPDADDAHDEDDEEVAHEQVKVASSRRRRQSRRRYKIQEVIKRGQILLIQAVKEERGNKGAAMTTYLSLAGRYCVLMPNTARGGGISRKIANGSDRKRLKSVMSELEVAPGMGVIVRTAGAKRTKAEIKRDYEYLSRLWDEIRDTTLKSIAPALIHEEGNLVKRSIRDLYNKDISEVLIQGETAYKTAKAFMKMLMPSHAKNVKHYKDDIPLYLRYNVERQIEDSLKSIVQLKSGGYLVIHPTEALVSVDVNSGRSTKERNVERTALKTNSEAAVELARQMRLRDLAGLIVVDFIDMDEHKNNRAVERKMKDAISRDRARIQTSRISQFGLMEISRQRRRRSLLEGSTAHCDHCEGVGRKRTIESSALAAIRAVEDIGVRRQAKRIRLKVSSDVALYIFNEKRDLLQHVDDTSGLFTELVGDEELIRPNYEIEIVEKAEDGTADPLVEIETEFRKQRQKDQRTKEKARRNKKSDDAEAEEERAETSDDEDENKSKKRRRRRGRRGGRGKNREENSEQTENAESQDAGDKETEGAPKPKRGRRKAPSKTSQTDKAETVVSSKSDDDSDDDKPKRKRTTRKAPARKTASDQDESEAESKPKKRTRRKAPAKKSAKAAELTEEAKDKPKSRTRRKAPAKKVKPEEDAPTKSKAKASKTKTSKAKKTKADEAKSDAAPKTKVSKSTARRKAPTKKVDEKEMPSKAKPKATSKTKAKAPSKTKAKAASKAKSKDTDAETAKSEKPKPKARRKAPAKKAAPAPKSETEKPKAKAKRKAPAKKAEAAPAEKPAEKKPEEAQPDAKASTARRKAPARKAPAETPVETPSETAETSAPEKPKRRRWFGKRKKD